LKQHKKKNEEAEFERMLAQDAEVRGARRPIPTGDPEENEQTALGELEKGIAEVKQQTATISSAGGFDIEVVGVATETPAPAPTQKIDSDELQKKFSGRAAEPLPSLDEQIQDLLGGAKPAPAAAPAKTEDAFDLDATLAELKQKIQEEPPARKDPVVPPASPAAPQEISIDLPAPETAPQPELKAAPVPEPVTEGVAVSAPATDGINEAAEQADAELVQKMQNLQQSVAGFKAVVLVREKRVAELVELDKRIQADMQEIQRRLDSSLAKLESLESSATAVEQQMPAAPAVPRRALRIDKSVSPPKIDVVVDEEAAPPRSAASVAAGSEPPKFKKVFELADQGLGVAEIAQQLGIGKGQVELFLKLREKGKMS
jgi:uncharacterized phage infection (PIP) family protein YhgE